MAMRELNRLTPLAVKNAPKGTVVADGGNLYLQVSDSGAKSWLFIYGKDGRQRRMGIGPLITISLAEARKRAQAARTLLVDGIDPMQAKKDVKAKLAADKERAAAELAKRVLFKVAAAKYIAANKAGWSNPKHAAQWAATLKTYAYPVIGDMAISSVKVEHVMQILEPIWADKTETATRVRGRIDSVWSWGKLHGHCAGDNPAAWKDNLEHLLPAPSKVALKRNNPALPIDQTPDFMSELHQVGGMGALALEFAIMNISRSGEVRLAHKGEVDREAKLWVIPAKRMKIKTKDHRVPLTDDALALLDRAQQLAEKLGIESTLLFPSDKATPLSDMTLSAVIKRMNEGKDPKPWIDPKDGREVVPHGFRSTFKDWASERTSYPNEVSEMAMAHTIENKVEAHYRRGELLEKRRTMMEDWQQFCSGSTQTTPKGSSTPKAKPARKTKESTK